MIVILEVKNKNIKISLILFLLFADGQDLFVA